MSKRPRIPAILLTGYLGAGKTTAINRLLEAGTGKRIAVLVNDFGDINIDAELIESRDDQVISLKNGCVCCTIADDLSGALDAQASRADPPDLLVVEASGVADPNRIAGHVGGWPGVELLHVVTMVDAATIAQRLVDKYVGSVVAAQIARADIMVLNKCDLTTRDQLDAVILRIVALAPLARLVVATGGEIDPALILHARSAGNEMARTGETHHHATPSLDVLTWRPQEPVDAREIARIISSARDTVHRAKGFLRDKESGGTVLLQAAGGDAELSHSARNGEPGLVVFVAGGSEVKSRLLSRLNDCRELGPV